MTLQEQIRRNRARTVMVLFGFGVLIAAIGLALGQMYDPSALGIVGVFGIGYGLISWFAADKMVARAAGAHPATREQYPELYRAVENAAIAAGMAETPAVYVIDDPAPNAFAAGRDPKHAYVAATTGILEILDKRELDGVMAHEIAHIRNRDVRLMSLVAVLVGVIALVCDMLMRMTFWGGGRRSSSSGNGGVIFLILGIVVFILAPILAMMLQMSLSRRREYLADAGAVEMTGDPEGLARALAKLGLDIQPLRKVTRATAHMYIESPLRDHKGLRSSLGGLFDTHPPLQERITKLEQLGGFTLGVDVTTPTGR